MPPFDLVLDGRRGAAYGSHRSEPLTFSSVFTAASAVVPPLFPGVVVFFEFPFLLMASPLRPDFPHFFLEVASVMNAGSLGR